MVDVKTIIEESQEKMDMAVLYLEEALGHMRAGKASTRLLDGILVDSYGSMVPISNVAAVTTPDARSITIKPWDKSMFRVIEKAIIDSDLGIMPENNGEIIRIGIPPLPRNAVSNSPNNVKLRVKQPKSVSVTHGATASMH